MHSYVFQLYLLVEMHTAIALLFKNMASWNAGTLLWARKSAIFQVITQPIEVIKSASDWNYKVFTEANFYLSILAANPKLLLLSRQWAVWVVALRLYLSDCSCNFLPLLLSLLSIFISNGWDNWHLSNTLSYFTLCNTVALVVVEALMKNWLLVNAKIRSWCRKSWKAFFRKKGREAKKKKTPSAIQAPSSSASSPPQLLSFRFRACNKRWQRLLCLCCWTIIPPQFIASRLRVALLPF